MGRQKIYAHNKNEMKKGLLALILAAGEGTRFKSERTKVLHPILGKSMLQLGLDCVRKLKPERIYIVVGHQKSEVEKEIISPEVSFIYQRKQLGTAQAVKEAQPLLEREKDKDVLVIYGDVPLLTAATLKALLSHHRRGENCLTLMSAELENPKGFGRLIRSGNNLEKIVEERDATPAQRRIKEVNAGVYIFKVKDLLQDLPKVSNLNRKGEYYLTDIVEIFARQKKKIDVYKTSRAEEVAGINSRLELAKAAEVLRMKKIEQLSEKGVTVFDPQTTWIDLDVKIGRDTIIYTSVVVEGASEIGHSCKLYPFVHLVNTRVGNRVKILTSSMLEDCIIEDDAQVGPFTHLRPKTIIRKGAKVGNFVEMKDTDFGPKSKAGHLTYLGDCKVEDKVNIGAGTITCNYDGRKKHKTHIETEAFIGSGSELVAPVRIGKKAYVGAGSTITKNVKPESLAVERSRQIERPAWAKKRKKKK